MSSIRRAGHCLESIILLGAAIAAAAAALAQSYPSKPIRMVTSEPGGGSELLARIIAQGLSAQLGQQVVVESRGGASGWIAGQAVAQAQPDGYTLLFYSNSLWLVPFLRENVRFDPLRDFAPITLAGTSPNILVVTPSLQVASVRELIALAKARPGDLNYGAGTTGSANHLAGELFKSMTGINVVRISYKGAGGAINALMAGEVHFMFPTANAGGPHVKSGRLKALAVTSAAPSALAPGLPTVAASGLPGYESGSTYGMFATARTPETVVKRLWQEAVHFLGLPEVRSRLLAVGVEGVGGSPEEFVAAMKSEMVRMGKVIKEAGIHDE